MFGIGNDDVPGPQTAGLAGVPMCVRRNAVLQPSSTTVVYRLFNADMPLAVPSEVDRTGLCGSFHCVVDKRLHSQDILGT